MARRIILLSGPIAAGKTSLGDALVDRYGFMRLKTQQLIQATRTGDLGRGQLQVAGEELDRETGGKWVAQALLNEAQRLPVDAEILVDAVRTEAQAQAVRNAFGSRVVHIHLTAPDKILTDRYRTRKGTVLELPSYREVQANPTEQQVEKLANIADIVIDTHDNTREEVVVRVVSQLDL